MAFAVPWPLNIVAAAGAAAEGAAALASVRTIGGSEIGPSASSSSAASSLSSTPATSSASAAAAKPQGVVNLIFQGDVYGFDDMMKKRIVDSLRDLIDNKDVVIIGPGSRQAAMLGG
jgi:hypothetical protein